MHDVIVFDDAHSTFSNVQSQCNMEKMAAEKYRSDREVTRASLY